MKNRWPHRWFGCWEQMGARYAKCPSIYQFMDANWKPHDLDKVIHYLECSPRLAIASKISFPCVIADDDPATSYWHNTDGLWRWASDLPHYILTHGVSIPDEFLLHIRSQDYQVQSFNLDELQRLDETLEHPQMSDGASDLGHTGLELRKKREEAPLRLEEADHAFRSGDYEAASKIYEDVLPCLMHEDQNHTRKLEYCKKSLTKQHG